MLSPFAGEWIAAMAETQKVSANPKGPETNDEDEITSLFNMIAHLLYSPIYCYLSSFK